MAALKRKTEETSKARKGAGSEGRDRTLAKEKGESEREGLERPAAPQAAGGDRARAGVLIRLEGSIDEMLHEIKLTGGLPEFEATLRQARRILVRSHVE